MNRKFNGSMHCICAANLYLFTKLFAFDSSYRAREAKKNPTAQILPPCGLYHVFCSHEFVRRTPNTKSRRVNGAKMMEAILYFGRPTDTYINPLTSNILNTNTAIDWLLPSIWMHPNGLRTVNGGERARPTKTETRMHQTCAWSLI